MLVLFLAENQAAKTIQRIRTLMAKKQGNFTMLLSLALVSLLSKIYSIGVEYQ